MSYVTIDERRRITDATEDRTAGGIWVADDMRGWNLYDEGVPRYKLSEDNWVQKRSDAEMKKDKKAAENRA